jgi:predicted RNA-binding protein with PIN domain
VRDHLPVRWIVDGNNVMGARPDGWWRDRGAAAKSLAERVAVFAADSGDPVTLVFDGRPRDLGQPGIELLFADRPGRNAADQAIAERVEGDADPTAITVVTSDRELAARVEAAGAQVEGAGRFRARLDHL